MENAANNKNGMSEGQAFLEEWKKRRKEEEEKFLKELNDPEHKREMQELKGKIVRNGKIVSTS